MSLWFWAKAELAVETLTAVNIDLSSAMAVSAATQLAMEARLKMGREPDLALLLAAESADLTLSKGLGVIPESMVALHETLRRNGGWDISPFGSRPENRGIDHFNPSQVLDFSLQFSPDGSKVLTLHAGSLDLDLTAAVFNLNHAPIRSPEYRWPIMPEASHSRAEAWFADSRRVLSVSTTGEVHLWSNGEGQLPSNPTEPAKTKLGNLRFTEECPGMQAWLRPDGQNMSVVQVLDTEGDSGVLIEYSIIPERLEPITIVREVALSLPDGSEKTRWKLSPDQKWLMGDCDGKDWLFPVSGSVQSVSGGHRSRSTPYHACQFSGDCRWLVVRDGVRHVAVIDLRKESTTDALITERRVISHSGSLESVCISSDGKWVAATGQNTVLVARTDTSLVRHLYVDAETVFCAQFSPDGRWLAAGTEKGTVTVWSVDDIEKGAEGTQLSGLPTPAVGVEFSPDGNFVAAMGCGYH